MAQVYTLIPLTDSGLYKTEETYLMQINSLSSIVQSSIENLHNLVNFHQLTSYMKFIVSFLTFQKLSFQLTEANPNNLSMLIQL